MEMDEKSRVSSYTTENQCKPWLLLVVPPKKLSARSFLVLLLLDYLHLVRMSSFTFDRPALLKALRISFLLCVVMVVVVCAIAIVDADLGTTRRTERRNQNNKGRAIIAASLVFEEEARELRMDLTENGKVHLGALRVLFMRL